MEKIALLMVRVQAKVEGSVTTSKKLNRYASTLEKQETRDEIREFIRIMTEEAEEAESIYS